MFCRLVYDLLASGEWWDTILADSDRWGARKFTIGPNGSRKRPEGEFPGAPAIRIGQDGVPRLGRGCKPMDRARKHGGPGLPEDFCVCAAAAMPRLSPFTSISGTRALHGQPRQP